MVAADGGEVIEVGSNKSYGNYCLIRHNEDIVTRYAHCDSITVEQGDLVGQGFPIGTLGSTGAKAIANILVGSVNPSGRLADTFWTEHRFNPVHANFGRYSYTGNTIKYGGTHGNNPAGGSPSKATMYDHTGVYYVVYQEGIYNGYRYTETRYEDKVLGAENVGEYDYNSVVKYPFGFGLSYTNFE